MNVIDRAFIRAYELEGAAASGAPRDSASKPTATVAAPVRTPSAPAGSVLHPAPPKPHFRVVSEPTAAIESRSATSERRPLSVFAAPGPTVEAQFRPALEVDAFRWSPTCNDLVNNHKPRWQSTVDALLAADDAGRSLIGLVGATAGVGATTVLACLGRLLIDAGKKNVALVDGNFAKAGLAAELGLAVDLGWEDVLSGRAPLAEAVVHSLGDRQALLPLVRGGAAAAEQLASIHASVTAGVLRYHYDMVLFDLGNLADPVQCAIAEQVVRHCRLDGMAIVARSQDQPLLQPSRLQQSSPELASLCLGVIENQPRLA